MCDNVEEGINSFFAKVKDLRNRIDDLTEGFRTILLLSLLDSLSKSAFPEESMNRARFLRLIDQYSNWEYKDHVSLPLLLLAQSRANPRDYAILQLFLQTGVRVSELCDLKLSDIDFEARTIRVKCKGQAERQIELEKKALEAIRNYLNAKPETLDDHLFLNKDGQPISQRMIRKIEVDLQQMRDLQQEVESRISKWPEDRILRPHESDLPAKELEVFKKGGCKDAIEKARYAALLWVMRNSLIHEFSTPGHGVALSPDNSTPYYHGFYDEHDHHSWELYIPAQAISQIVQSCSDNLKKGFEQRKKNPWDSFRSSWF